MSSDMDAILGRMRWKKIGQDVSLPMTLTEIKLMILIGKTDNKVMHQETASFLAIAWRCLYREISICRIYNKEMIICKPLFEALKCLIERVRAFGKRWRVWFLRQQHHWNSKNFPQNKRKMILIQFNEEGDFSIEPKLWTWYHKLRQEVESKLNKE